MSKDRKSPPNPVAPIDTGGQTVAGVDLPGIKARARGLDLGGDYELPPGDPITHFAAGLAKILASNIFLTGLDVEFAAEHVGYFTAPHEHRKHVVDINLLLPPSEYPVQLVREHVQENF